MTISRTDSRLDRERYVLADVDDHDQAVRCPLCRGTLDELHTPDVPPRVLEDGSQEVSARAYLCSRHRVDVVAFEPAAVAPESFAAVEARLDGDPTEIAVPEVTL